MSTYYSFYTEARIGGTWYCIDPRVLQLERDGRPMSYVLNNTYWSGSRSYFGEAYDKLKEIASKTKFEDTSAEFRMHKIIDWSGKDEDVAPYYDSILYAIPLSKLNGLYEESKRPDECGLYKKRDVTLYMAGEIEDLYECEIDPEKYSMLAPEAQKLYQYYEWNYCMSWKFQIPILYKLVCSRIREFEDVNFLDCDDVRVLMYAS